MSCVVQLDLVGSYAHNSTHVKGHVRYLLSPDQVAAAGGGLVKVVEECLRLGQSLDVRDSVSVYDYVFSDCLLSRCSHSNILCKRMYS